jgi:hypothetical protein
MQRNRPPFAAFEYDAERVPVPRGQQAIGQAAAHTQSKEASLAQAVAHADAGNGEGKSG